MPETNISRAAYGNLATELTDYSVATKETEGATEQEETTWQLTKWPAWYGYYTQIPELKISIDTRAVWTIGKGYTADPETQVILEHVTGSGIDTFNTILKNMVITRQICGDAYCEIMRDADMGIITNLKPLDPSTIKVILDRHGIIKRYEQTSKTNNAPKKFQPSEIFRLTRNRVADNALGKGIIEVCENTLLMRNEGMTDMKKLMHRHVQPMIKWTLDTDDESKITQFKATADKATANAENIFIPKGAVEHEIISVPANATLNPLPWIQYLSDFFWQATGTPQVLIGGAMISTEANSKIQYLSFEQSVEDEQLDIETQVWQQLGLMIELTFPATIQNELISDEKKNAGYGVDMQANEMTAGAGT